METNASLEELFESLFPTESEQEEVSDYSFSSEGEIDDAIEKIKELNEDEKRFKDIFKEKSDKQNYELQCKLSGIEKKREWILSNVKEVVMKSTDKKESPTQFKKDYLSGSVVIKKSKVNLLKPELTEDQILKDFADYKKSKTEVTLDWAALKKNLKILNGKVYCIPTGEDLTSTISTETTSETVIIK